MKILSTLRRPGTPALLLMALAMALPSIIRADDVKNDALVKGGAKREGKAGSGALPRPAGGAGYRFTLTNGAAQVPVIVVGGTPFQMGWQLGYLMREEIQKLVPTVLAGFKKELKVSDETLDQVWATTAGYTDARLLQQLTGLAEGSGVPVRALQHVHAVPLLMPYSCSSIAAWGSATEDGHLYQTRNLDWSLRAGAHEFPAVVVYLPAQGHAHVTPAFAGFIGAHCGMNDAGIVLSEMGDAGAKEMPYNLHAPHFTAWFRTLLYDAGSLGQTLEIFRGQPQTKRYHFVFGDGRTEKRAVKIRTQTAEAPGGSDIRVWKDADTADELSPKVLSCVVYQDEGRGAFPTLERERGRLNGPKLIALANSIPIKGGNVMNAVFDATALRLWVSYAGQGEEAYQRPYVSLDLQQLDGDRDGRSDLEEGGADRNGDGRPDFFDAGRR
jgi:hypothetical protein